MARKSRGIRREQRTVGVDDCRVRLQTGQATVFVDARKAEDHARSPVRIAGSVRLSPDDRILNPPCHKHNYIVVYCA
jgi:hypothetical protein